MTTTEYAANTARAFLAAEIAMASVNCEAPIVTRTQAEQLLDLYFGLVEQAVPWTENNPLDRRSLSEHHNQRSGVSCGRSSASGSAQPL